MDRLVPLDLRVIPDPSAPRAPQDYPEPQDWKASRVLKESKEPLALRDPLELTAFRDRLANQEPKGRPEDRDHRELPVYAVNQECPGQRDIREWRDLLVSPDLKDPPDSRASLGETDRKESQDPWDQSDHQVPLENPDFRVKPESKVRWDGQARRERPER